MVSTEWGYGYNSILSLSSSTHDTIGVLTHVPRPPRTPDAPPPPAHAPLLAGRSCADGQNHPRPDSCCAALRTPAATHDIATACDRTFQPSYARIARSRRPARQRFTPDQHVDSTRSSQCAACRSASPDSELAHAEHQIGRAHV